MKSNQIWDLAEQLASTRATIGDDDLQLTIANGSAASGAKITIGTEAVSLFSVESSNSNETLVDVYVRGDDLIAKYQSSEDELDRELYWRVLDVDLPADSFALEMIYSLQTDLLDTQPDPRIV